MTSPTGARRKLRIGLLTDSDRQPAWVHEIVAAIATSAFAEIVLVVENAARPPQRTFFERLRGIDTRYLLYSIYSRVDGALNRTERSAFSSCDIGPLLADCPRLQVTPVQGRFTDAFRSEDVDRIATFDLDVLLRFGFRILKGKILDTPRHGIWSYHHDDNRVVRGGPPAFHQVMRGYDTSGCILQRLSEDLDNGRVIDRAVVRTVKSSVRRNQEQIFWVSTTMMPRRLEDLWRTGHVSVEDEAPNVYPQPMFTVPANAEMATSVLRLAGRNLRDLLMRALFVEQWELALYAGPPGELRSLSFHRFRRVPSAEGTFRADPFLVQVDGRDYVFFEEYDYLTARGHIAVLEIDERGRPGESRVALRRPYHLSYPFLLEHGGALYMIPETAERRAIELYRCERFPDRWVLEKTLMGDVDAADATIAEVEGTFYLFFATRTQTIGDYDTLHVYWADDPLAQWHPVANSPIKCDVRSSRPAGRLLRIDGRLYRPAQIGAPEYGWGISLNEVVALSRERYEERVARRIEPAWQRGLLGVHTLQHHATPQRAITAIDVLHRIPRLRRTRSRARARRARLRNARAT